MARSVYTSRWLCLLFVVALLGCDEGVQHPEALGEVLRTQESAVDKAAVTVDDRAVDVAQLRAFWEQHPELERDEALDAFIEQEVMYAPALERGFADRKAVAVARKRAMVRLLLERTVEQEVTEETLDEDEIERMVEKVEGGVGHPVGLRASHILVSVRPNKKGKKKAKDTANDAAFEEARAVLGDIQDALSEAPTPFELLETKREFTERVDDPLSVVVNTHLRFPIVEADRSTLPDDWLNVVPEFREPAVELARAGDYGVLSSPVKSPFGWHLIVVHEKLSGAKADADAVRAVAVARLLDQKRSEKVTELFEGWTKSASMRTYPNVIEEAEELE